MSEVVCIKSQEEYEDDFEKDLDWLIGEEGRSEDQVSWTSLYKFNLYKIIGRADLLFQLYFLFFSPCFIVLLCETWV